jgi:hypothetical protein
MIFDVSGLCPTLLPDPFMHLAIPVILEQATTLHATILLFSLRLLPAPASLGMPERMHLNSPHLCRILVNTGEL